MPAVMTFKTTSGHKAQCDARCYNAIGPDCDCMCGGKNHQKGYEQAVENTQKMHEEFMQNATDKLFMEHPIARESVITFNIKAMKQKVTVKPNNQ